MSIKGYSICSSGASLVNDLVIDDHRIKSCKNVTFSSNNGKNSHKQSESLHCDSNDITGGEILPEEISSTKVSSRGRKIINKVGFRGVKVEYNLRQSSIVNRINSELSRKAPKQPKPKSKPPPLSKYRRRAANARERGRMQEINEAFENLRSLIPETHTSSVENQSTSRGKAGSEDPSSKMTKIMTLRLAMSYISALRELLKNSAEEAQESSGVSECSEYPETSSVCSILEDISPTFSSDEAELLVSDSCSDEIGLLDSEGETWRN